MNLLIDLIVLLIIVFCVIISAKRGFVKVLVEVVGFVAAIFLTFTISTPLADITYDKIIEPPIIEAVADSAADTAEKDIWSLVPSAVSENAEKLGISVESFTQKVTSNISNGAQTAVKTASQDIIKPVITKVLGLVYSVVILLVLLFVVKFLAKFINKLFSFSIIGKANRVLGGIIGIPKGIIFAILFCMIVSLIVSLYGDFLIFTVSNIEKTYIFRLLAKAISF